jgi:UDPglucose--hexose-1-phosphate uridylyltransferase
MSEMRKDPLTGRWVIIAAERLKRPNDFKKSDPPSSGQGCPFCPGHEELTPPEIYAVRPPGSAANGPGWSLRIIPNRFPALRVEGPLERAGEGLFDRVSGVGAHEVIVESPDHNKDLGDLPASVSEEVLWAWSERLRDLSNDVRLRCAIVFKNHGEAAGASLSHPHSQLLALPMIPMEVEAKLRSSLNHYREKERCLLCDIVRQERKDGARIIWENDAFVALAPWAATKPFETWIVPKVHQSHFEDEPRTRIALAGEALQTVLSRLSEALERPAYNIVLHTGPFREHGLSHAHWHLEILPSVAFSAGFEIGSGYAINPVPPEESAAFLRKLGPA